MNIEENIKKLSERLNIGVGQLKEEMDKISAPEGLVGDELNEFRYNSLVSSYRKKLSVGGEIVSIINMGYIGMNDFSDRKRLNAQKQIEKFGRERAIEEKYIDENDNVLEKYTDRHREAIRRYPGLLAMEGKKIPKFDLHMKYAIFFVNNGIIPGIIDITVPVPSYVKLNEQEFDSEECILYDTFKEKIKKEYALPNFTKIDIKGRIKGDSLIIKGEPQYETKQTYEYNDLPNIVPITPISEIDNWNEENKEKYNAFFVTKCIASTIDITKTGSYMINFTDNESPLIDENDNLVQPLTGFSDKIDFIEGSPVILVGKTRYKISDNGLVIKNVNVYSVCTKDIYRKRSD